MGKTRDLWSAEKGTKAVNRPQPVTIAKGWRVQPDILPIKKEAPRRRKYAPVRPNNRAAVAVPLPGQSYNPTDSDHQAALSKVVKKLQRRKAKDAKVVHMLTVGRGDKTGGSFLTDKTWEEEVKEFPSEASKKKKKKTAEQERNKAKERRKKERKQKKLGKKGSEREARRAMKHRRHPNRDTPAKEAEVLDKILEAHEETMASRQSKAEKRRQERKENATTKHFGRYYHTPLVEDVVPSSQLVGSLRHMSGGYVHPVLERMKSLEERNLVPARMRHVFNKRKVLKPKGEVKLKRESFGVLPDTTF